MKTVAARELEERISEMLRLVQETGEIVEVTEGGEVVAHLVPVGNSQRPAEVLSGATWADMDHGRAMNAGRATDGSAVENPEASAVQMKESIEEVEADEREWETILRKPHVREALRRLAREARRQVAVGETEEGGFAFE